MKKILLILTLVLGAQGFAQQEAIYSQYMFNQFVINPAYAGSRNSMSAVLLHRTRWVGMEGAPTTSTLSVHSGIKKSNFAWGLNFASDRLGATSNTYVGGTGAYHVRMSRGKLAFGLRLGMYNSAVNGANLDFRDETDEFNTGAKQSAITPSGDFGIYYYTRKFYIGLAFNHMGVRQMKYDDLPNASFYLSTYTTLGMGYAFVMNENLTLKPSLLLKATNNSEGDLDLNISALLYQRVWLGVSLRNQNTVNFLLDINITDYLRFGYSYDTFINKLNSASSGAHEIFVGFYFSLNQPKTVSPRYL